MRSLFRFLRPMRYARRKAVYAGLFGGNRKWMALGGLAWAFNMVGRLFGLGEPAPVYAEELKPGQRLVIAHPEAKSRRQRRKERSG